MDTTPVLELDDIQGIVLRGYGRLRFVRYLFVVFAPDDAEKARAWLTGLAGDVTSARPEARGSKPDAAVNVAFTSVGLAALGFADAELDTFPRSFHVGMTDPDRS